MAKKENYPTWICDRCKAEKVSKSNPNSASDPWGHLMIDQIQHFDHYDYPWAPRMREPLLLCGKCIEDIITTVNTCLKD